MSTTMWLTMWFTDNWFGKVPSVQICKTCSRYGTHITSKAERVFAIYGIGYAVLFHLVWFLVHLYRVVQKKTAQSLMHHHSSTVCCWITSFSLKYSGKIIVYQSMQNLHQLVKYSLINSRNWIHVMSDVTLHVNVTPQIVEDRQLIKTL